MSRKIDIKIPIRNFARNFELYKVIIRLKFLRFLMEEMTWPVDYIEVIFSAHWDCTHNQLYNYHIEVEAVEWR